MKTFFRKTILATFYSLYLFFRPFFRKPEITVLLYHSVSDRDWLYAVSPGEFERQIRHLSRNYTVVTLNDIADYVKGRKKISGKVVAVTFDDGYQDFLTTAVPILKKYQVPATVFVLAGKVDRGELGNKFDLLGWEDLERLAKEGLIHIGSHGLTHRKLTKIASEEMKNEIKTSKSIIEAHLGRTIRFFAYPKGDFKFDVAKEVEDAGYKGAVTAVPSPIRLGTNSFLIGRVDINHPLSFFEFKVKITRVGEWYWKLRKYYDKKTI